LTHGGKSVESHFVSKRKVTAFRFTEEELGLLDVIQGHTGIRSRLEALRAVLRHYAKSEGLEGDAKKKDSAKTSKEPR
jgi:hypothetical protein